MNDDGIPNGDVLHRGADSVHPAGIFMAKRVWQLDVALILPLAFNDVEVSPAKASAADTYDDIVRPGDLRVGDLFDNRPLSISM